MSIRMSEVENDEVLFMIHREIKRIFSRHNNTKESNAGLTPISICNYM